MIDNDDNFTSSEDIEVLQATVLAAAIQGDDSCREQLPTLYTAFEEPYRTVASTVLDQLREAAFVDQQTIRAALEGRRLTRRNADGKMEPLTAQQAINLIVAGDVSGDQAVAYVSILREQLAEKRRAEFRERAIGLAQTFGDDPVRLHQEYETLAAEVKGSSDEHPSEALRFFPYMQRLFEMQVGSKFLGLDSGFPQLNQVANRLDTGLWVLAAAPSIGKTTFAFQMCQQAAAINKLPVLFVSLEQSAMELRSKALARLAKLDTRSISRGRLRADDPQHMARLQHAGRQYFEIGRHLHIIEGDETTDVNRIGTIAADKMAQAGAKRCFIVLDYLQILPLRQTDERRVTSTKDRIDVHLTALRRLARRLDSPVLAISSENRQGYTSKSMDVFKESGGIEYAADIAAIMTVDKESTKEAAGKYRSIDLNIVKNRNGELGIVKLKFYPARAEFIETALQPVQGF